MPASGQTEPDPIADGDPTARRPRGLLRGPMHGGCRARATAAHHDQRWQQERDTPHADRYGAQAPIGPGGVGGQLVGDGPEPVKPRGNFVQTNADGSVSLSPTP